MNQGDMIQLIGNGPVTKEYVRKTTIQQLYEARQNGYTDALNDIHKHILNNAALLQRKIRQQALETVFKPHSNRFSSNRDIAEHFENEVARRNRVMSQITLYYKLLLGQHGKNEAYKSLNSLYEDIKEVVESIGVNFDHGNSLLLYLSTQMLLLEP